MISFQVNQGKKLKLFNETWWPQTRTEWLPMLLADNRKYWTAQTSPYGIPWKPLTRKYQIWKTAHYGNQPILRATGSMQDSAKIKSWGDRIFVETTKVGRFHQFGTLKMVSRPWMGVPDLSMNRLPEIAWRNILK